MELNSFFFFKEEGQPIFVIRTVNRIRWLSLDDYGFMRKSFKGKSANWIRNLGKRIVSLEQTWEASEDVEMGETNQ